jgi:hypothetical protein
MISVFAAVLLVQGGAAQFSRQLNAISIPFKTARRTPDDHRVTAISVIATLVKMRNTAVACSASGAVRVVVAVPVAAEYRLKYRQVPLIGVVRQASGKASAYGLTGKHFECRAARVVQPACIGLIGSAGYPNLISGAGGLKRFLRVKETGAPGSAVD